MQADENGDRKLKPVTRRVITGLVVVGAIAAVGGIWWSWMLWAGLILIEAACLAYYGSLLS
jgi:hypothetical protein